MKRKYRILIRVLFPVPFILGVIGYKLAGFPNADAFYGSFCCYFVSVYEKAQNPLMEISRWTAPIMTATWVFYSLSSMFAQIKNYFVSKNRDAVAIYCNDNTREARILSADIPHSFVVKLNEGNEGAFYPNVRTQILLLDEDRSNLEFYSKHDNVLKDRNVHMKLTNMDSNLLKQSNIHYFNINENIATMLWQEYPIILDVPVDQEVIHIAIVGDGELAEKMFMCGMVLNIFREDQHIVYHLFGKWKGTMAMLAGINTMNGDEVIMEGDTFDDSLEKMAQMDRIIVAEKYNQDMIEDLIYVCPDVPVYYYSKSNEDPSRFLEADNIHVYGNDETLYTKANFLDGHAFRRAKELNYILAERSETITHTNIDKHKESEWLKLDGETQSSLKFVADYYYLYMKLLAMGVDITGDVFEIERLEHARYCRYLALCHWKYGKPEDGTTKDKKNRISSLLKNYEELTDDESTEILQKVVFLVHQFRKLHE